MELFKLLGTIAIDNKDANKALDDTSEKGKQTESKLGKVFGGIGKGAVAVGKAVGTGMVVAGTAVAGLVTQSTSVFAEFEQLSGGAELMFGSAYQSVMEKAKNAYSTVQMSQNEYLQQVNGFATGLKTALGGNEQAAADLAHKIVKAEADIVAATGNSAENVQNAFNGIMKSNYTMLDNLQIGIKPTKEGFQEVIDKVNDWNKANGNATKYQIDNLADCQSALVDYIEMVGYSGYAGNEAAGTITGSMASVKASWQNLVSAMADDSADLGEYISEFTETLAPAFQNMMPKIQTALSGVVDLVNQLAPVLIAEIPGLLGQLLPAIVEAATGLVNSIVEILPGLLDMLVNDILPSVLNGFISIIGAIISALPSLVGTLVSALPTLLPQLINGLLSLVGTLCTMLPQIIQPLIDNLPTILTSIINAIVQNLPVIISGLVSLIVSLCGSIPQIIQPLIDNLPTIIMAICDAIITNLPLLIQGAIDLIIGLVDAIPSIVQALIDSIPYIIEMVIVALLSCTNALITGAIRLVFSLVAALPQIMASLREALPKAFLGIWNSVKEIFKQAPQWFADRFNAVVEGVTKVFKGIKDAITKPFEKARDAVKGIADKIKGFFKGEISLPKIKMPHFSLTPKGWKIGDLLQGSIPKLAIDWYAKAMNEPMIMDRPTIFGYNGATGELMGGGEAGSEVVSGTNTLMQMIRGAVATQNETLAYYLQNVVDILSDYCPAVLDRMEHPIPAVIGADQAADALLGPLDYRFGILAAQKGRGR